MAQRIRAAHSASPSTLQRTVHQFRDTAPARNSMHAISADLGLCVYFARTEDGLVKIGCTKDLYRRRHQLGFAWTDLLAVTPGTFDDEQDLHARFAQHRVRAREYYRPAPEIMRHINEIRDRMGVAAIHI